MKRIATIILKTLGLTFLLILFGIIIIIAIYKFRGNTKNVVNGLTIEKLMCLKKGLNPEQVIEKSGRPFEINARVGLHNLSCKNPKERPKIIVNNQTDIIKEIDIIRADTIDFCCEGNKEDTIINLSFVYSKEVIICKAYPMIWICFDEDYKFDYIGAKIYSCVNGRGIFLEWFYETDTSSTYFKYGEILRDMFEK